MVLGRVLPPAEGAPLAQQAEQIYLSTFGEEHPVHLEACYHLAGVLFGLGDLAGATAMLKRASQPALFSHLRQPVQTLQAQLSAAGATV